MQERSLPVSIIIPTHNRCILLGQTLEALGKQTLPPELMEVIVVADACTDETEAMVGATHAPYQLVLVQGNWQRASAARNAGAKAAHGALLIFLDDDILAVPQLVQAHLEAHQGRPGRVVIGYLTPMLFTQDGLFKAELRMWWEQIYTPLRQIGHRAAFTDLLSGNFSIQAGVFARLNGFNSELICHEDYEFGYRLLQEDIEFVYSQQAMGVHQEYTSLERSFKRKFDEGAADVQIGRLYPELKPDLLMTRLLIYSRIPSQIFRWLAFRSPRVGEMLIASFLPVLYLLDRLRLRGPWLRLLYGLMNFWYWRGVSSEINNLPDLETYLRQEKFEPISQQDTLKIDLSDGIGAAEHLIDKLRPASFQVWYGSQYIGDLPGEPGRERWRGAHLRSALVSWLANPLLIALAQADRIQGKEMKAKLLSIYKTKM
jgi:glycosyltransferase involved in cell wall biosynthesis